jgi:hypothetical protein
VITLIVVFKYLFLLTILQKDDLDLGTFIFLVGCFVSWAIPQKLSQTKKVTRNVQSRVGRI